MQSFVRETFPVGLLACKCTLLGDPGTGEAIVIDPGFDASLSTTARPSPGRQIAGTPAGLLARLKATDFGSRKSS